LAATDDPVAVDEVVAVGPVLVAATPVAVTTGLAVGVVPVADCELGRVVAVPGVTAVENAAPVVKIRAPAPVTPGPARTANETGTHQ
jgi:hypothetical protein